MPEIRVLNIPYKVAFYDAETLGAMGKVDTTSQMIRVSENLPIDSLATTLLHEIIHILSFSLGIGLTENQIVALEAGLYSALSDNGIYVRALGERIGLAYLDEDSEENPND